MSLLLRLEHKQKNSSNTFRIRIFLFLSYSFGIETINTFIHSVVPSKTIPDSRPKWAKSIPVSDQNGAKSLPDGTSHTYMTYMKEYPPPPPPGQEISSKIWILYSPIIVFKKQCHKLRPWLLFFISVAIALQLQIIFRSIC